MKVLKGHNLQHQQLKSSKTNESYSLSAVLSSALETKDFFIHHDVIKPGSRTSAPHYHEQTDEFVYVIKGQLFAIEGATECELTAGDSICFSANSKLLHHMENRSNSEAEILVINRQLLQTDVKFQAEL